MFRWISLLTASALLAAGCAANPEPIIDTKGVDPELLAEDMAECEAYTEEISVAQGVGKGAAHDLEIRTAERFATVDLLPDR